MNYEKIYSDFIADRRIKENSLTGYTEKHHIIPRSLGGNDSAENLIKLTAGDHYFAHCCLAKMRGGTMWLALSALIQLPGISKGRGKFSNRALVNHARISSAKLKAASASAQHKAGLSKLANSPKARLKKSDAMRRHVANGGHSHLRTCDKNYAKRTETMKLWYASSDGLRFKEETRQRALLNNNARTDKARAKMSAKSKAYCSLPEVKAKKSAAISGDKNPAKRPEVASVIREKAIERNRILSEFFALSGFSGNKKKVTVKHASEWLATNKSN